MAAIVGAAGLGPTLAALQRGAIVGLANKETLVCAGALMVAEIARHGATLLPVDSEHSAIFQVIELDRLESVDRIILTASGDRSARSTARRWRTSRRARPSHTRPGIWAQRYRSIPRP